MTYAEQIATLKQRLLEQLIAREGQRHGLADGAERDLAHHFREAFTFTESGELSSCFGPSLDDAIAMAKQRAATSYMFEPARSTRTEVDVASLDPLGRLRYANSKS